MKFDVIIANPPYGSLGTNVTQAIVDSLDFDEFVNLLPATNYRLSKTDLQKHVKPEEMSDIQAAFEDACVIPYIAKVYKNEVNALTPTQYRVKLQKDELSERYFLENIKRKPTYEGLLETGSQIKLSDDFSKTIFLPMRLSGNAATWMRSIGMSANAAAYKVAFDLIKTSADMRGGTPNCGTYVKFSTEEEKRNCGEFLFGAGHKFMQWLFAAMKLGVAHKAEHEFWLPKVDWKRKWAPEEILREYGYSEEEIEEVEERMSSFPDLRE